MPRRRGVTRAEPVTYVTVKAADLEENKLFEFEMMLPGLYKDREKMLKKAKQLNKRPDLVDIIRVLRYREKVERFWMPIEFYILNSQKTTEAKRRKEE